MCVKQTQTKEPQPSDLLGSQANSKSIGRCAVTNGIINIKCGLPAGCIPRQHNVVPVTIVYSWWHAQSVGSRKVQGGAVTVDAHQLLGVGHWRVWAAARTEMASKNWDNRVNNSAKSQGEKVKVANSHTLEPWQTDTKNDKAIWKEMAFDDCSCKCNEKKYVNKWSKKKWSLVSSRKMKQSWLLTSWKEFKIHKRLERTSF